MLLIDTHNHMYLKAFADDVAEVVARARNIGVYRILLPAIDGETHADLVLLAETYPDLCYPMMGLHPTSVKQNWQEEFSIVKNLLSTEKFFAIGETGIDLYWDTSFAREQEEAFRAQIELSLEYNLPVVIHSRQSFSEVIAVLQDYASTGLRGVFHAFSGNLVQANQAIDLGLFLGVGGVVTYKNSGLGEVIKEVGLEYLLLETDAPYLAPVPHRGKRNEPSFLQHVVQQIASLKDVEAEHVAFITSQNAIRLFDLPE
jgi:TatD DNase family protein